MPEPVRFLASFPLLMRDKPLAVGVDCAVARYAKRDAVRYIKAQFRVTVKRFDVMRLNITRLGMAMLADEVIALKNGCAPANITRRYTNQGSL